MIQNWNVEVTTENGNVFFVEYQTLMDSEYNDGFSAGTIIKSVQLKGYYLALGQLRECLVWDELKEAVKHAAIDNSSLSFGMPCFLYGASCLSSTAFCFRSL